MSISKWRHQIDAIDRRLVKLLSARARLSLAIGRLKRAKGWPLFHRQRERQIAENVRQANRGPLPDAALEHIFEQVLRATRKTVRHTLHRERRLARRRASAASGGARP